jgi:hypothetical protein
LGDAENSLPSFMDPTPSVSYIVNDCGQLGFRRQAMVDRYNHESLRQ